MPKAPKGGFYAVSKGRAVGVYLTWYECAAQVKGFAGARYKKFTNAADAEEFAGVNASSSNTVISQSINPVGDAATSTKSSSYRERTPDIQDESAQDVVYCDGACKGNGQEGSVAGVGVWWGRNDPRNIAERCPGDQTNNRAELIAILRILETVPISKKPLLIRSDSQYSIKCFKEWLPKWIANNFRTSNGSPVKNAGIIRCLSAHFDLRARSGQKILLEHVKGHSGEEGNEGADAMANMGAMQPVVGERDWAWLEQRVRDRIDDLGRISVVPPEVAEDHVVSRGQTVLDSKIVNVTSPPPAARFNPTKSLTRTESSPIVGAKKSFGLSPARSPGKEKPLLDPLVPPPIVDIGDVDFDMYADCLLSDEELANEEFD